MSSMIRSVARGVAKNRMKKQGYVKFCKHRTKITGKRFDSTFSEKWRDFVWHVK